MREAHRLKTHGGRQRRNGVHSGVIVAGQEQHAPAPVYVRLLHNAEADGIESFHNSGGRDRLGQALGPRDSVLMVEPVKLRL
jgi:hypothetical protein